MHICITSFYVIDCCFRFVVWLDHLQQVVFHVINLVLYNQIFKHSLYEQGPTGYEGAFRKACEVTMRVMRSKTDALMRYCSLKFIY